MSTLRHLARRTARATGDALLWAGAVAGSLCAVLALFGAVAGFGVVLFRTGSMSPAIPAGSAALVRTVTADQVEVGDVVTVDRPGLLPITHRVVAVEVAGTGDPDARALTLRGDANTADDPTPYTVTSVRRVVASVPGVAQTIAAAGDPRVLGPVAVGVSALITCMLWPRRRRPGPAGPIAAPTQTESAAAEPEGRTAPLPRVTPAHDPHPAAGPARPAHPSRPRRRSGRHVRQAVPVLALVAVALAGAPRTAQAAVPGAPDETGPGLVLGSTLSTPSRLMAPGDVRDWLLTLSTHGLTQGEITRTIEVSGSANPDLRVEVALCGTPVGDLDCSDPVTIAGPVSPTAAGEMFVLPAQDALSTERLRVRVTLAAGTDAQGLRSSLTFIATGDGVAAAVVPPRDPAMPDDGARNASEESAAGGPDGAATSGVLAVTGLARPWPLLLVAAALLVTGTAHLVVHRNADVRRRTR